jgi:putative membrane protein insertion efficiency factor
MIKNMVLFLIRAYQHWISPVLSPRCRFYPSCSSYSRTAIERYSLAKGSYLSVRRLLRCHPWHAGGLDFVP